MKIFRMTIPNIFTNVLSYILARLDWDSDVAARHLWDLLTLSLVDLVKTWQVSTLKLSCPQTLTMAHFFSTISLSTVLSTRLHTCFSWQAGTETSLHTILGSC